VSLQYIDTDQLKLYTYHSIWIKYIHGVVLGHLWPKPEYVNGNVIDYMGSIYFLKFDSDMKSPKMIAKALGIYPNAVPYKELVGVRGQHSISISNCNYTCAYFYEEPIYSDTRYEPPITPPGGNDSEILGHYLWKEFLTKFKDLYARDDST
jgi:hypothetical protein